MSSIKEFKNGWETFLHILSANTVENEICLYQIQQGCYSFNLWFMTTNQGNSNCFETTNYSSAI